MKTRILEIIEKQGGNNELLFDYWKFVDEIKFDFAFTAKFLKFALLEKTKSA